MRWKWEYKGGLDTMFSDKTKLNGGKSEPGFAFLVLLATQFVQVFCILDSVFLFFYFTCSIEQNS